MHETAFDVSCPSEIARSTVSLCWEIAQVAAVEHLRSTLQQWRMPRFDESTARHLAALVSIAPCSAEPIEVSIRLLRADGDNPSMKYRNAGISLIISVVWGPADDRKGVSSVVTEEAP